MTSTNFDPSDPDKMRLPKGKTCGDCVHIRRCKAMFGHVETDTYCDWSPSRAQFLEQVSERNPQVELLKEKLAAAESHIAALEQQLAAERAISSALRESMAAIHNTIRMDGVSTSLGALLSASKAAYDKSRIPVEGAE